MIARILNDCDQLVEPWSTWLLVGYLILFVLIVGVLIAARIILRRADRRRE